MLPVADEIRNVVDEGDFRVDDGMHATAAAYPQTADGQFVADIDGLPRPTELRRRLRVGVQRCVRVRVNQRGSREVSTWSGC